MKFPQKKLCRSTAPVRHLNLSCREGRTGERRPPAPKRESYVSDRRQLIQPKSTTSMIPSQGSRLFLFVFFFFFSFYSFVCVFGFLGFWKAPNFILQLVGRERILKIKKRGEVRCSGMGCPM